VGCYLGRNYFSVLSQVVFGNGHQLNQHRYAFLSVCTMYKLEFEKIQSGMLHETVKSTMRRVLQDFGYHVET
jgi:hypothetical protein